MTRALQLGRSYGFDVLVVIAAVAAALQVGLATGPEKPQVASWFAILAVTLLVLVLLGRRHFRFAAPAAVWIAAAGLSFADGRLVPFPASAFIAGFAAAFLLGNLRDPRQAWLGFAIVLAGAAIVVYNDPSHDPGELVFTPLLFAIGWLAGFAMRGRSEQIEVAEERALVAEREREVAARIAVAEERSRIARELHDVVAHAVSVMVLQVGAVRHGLHGASNDQLQALESVEGAGRTALAEMRQLLGAMRRQDEGADLSPQPELEMLDALTEQIAGAGLAVKVHREGDVRRLPRGLEVSAYRIIREALTNALRHANADEAEVTISYRPSSLGIDVRDDGTGPTDAVSEGFGLVGIRERVKIYGGEITTGAGAEGGFALHVDLPVPRGITT